MKKQLGLTLIELLVSLAAVAILMSLAVPAFKNFSASNKQSARINQLTGAFSIARSEAVTRNLRVTLAADSNDWSNGWSIAETTSNTEIKVGGPIPSSTTVTSTGATSVIFKSDGTTTLTADLTITFCDPSRPAGTHGMKITLIPTGRYSVEKNVNCP